MTKYSIPLLSLVLSLSSANLLAEQTSDYFCGPENPPEARSLDTILPALYGIVSGKAGSVRNWPLLKDLFAKNAVITPVYHDENGQSLAEMITVDAFIALNKSTFKDQDFFEQEIARQTFVFGHMANILSHYQSRDVVGAEPYAQGINSFQLLNDGRRWCVISVTWDSDQKAHPLNGKLF